MAKGEENAVLCWNCKYITKCRPQTRPQRACPRFCLFVPLDKATIAKWLSVSRHQVYFIIEEFGEDEIIEMLKIRGHSVDCTKFNGQIQFYYLGEC